MQKQAAILERTEWAERPDVWHGQVRTGKSGLIRDGQAAHCQSSKPHIQIT